MARKRVDSAPQFNVGDESVLIQQAPGSTAPLLDIKDSTGASLMTVASTGAMTTSAPMTSPELSGTPTAPTAAAGTNTTQIATTAFVTTADNLKANIASPTFTGVPLAPTAAPATNTTQIATTAFVRTEVSNLIASAPAALDTLDELAAALGDDANFATTVTNSLATKAPIASPTFTGTVSGVTKSMVGLGSVDNTSDVDKPVSTAQQTALNLKANLASPTLTGTPLAPTAAAGTNTTQIATTAFVTTADNLKANIASPTFTGVPLAPTAAPATNTTQIATTAFVRTEVSNLIASAPAALDTLDELAAALGDDANFATTTATAIGLKAPLASPALTGTPTAPTAAVGTNTTQLATTAFVQATNPTGAVIAFAGSSAPSGWFLCFGQEVSISSNGALYAVVGTTYGSLTNGSGGVGTTHFRLPDLRGRTIAGIDNMGGVDAGRLSIANTPGTTTGAETVTIGTANLPPHQHAIDHDHASFAMTTNVNSQLHSHSYTTVYLYTGNVDYGNYYNGYYPTGSSTGVENIAHAHSSDVNVPNFTGSSGNGGFANTALNNMQPTIVLNYIIKA